MKTVYKLPIIVILCGLVGIFCGVFLFPDDGEYVAGAMGVIFAIAAATGCLAYLLEKKVNHQ